MHAVVLAGGIPGPEDPLSEESGGRPKSLIDIAGRPMAQWVGDALEGSTHVDSLIVVGLGPDAGLRVRKPVGYL